MRQVEIIASDDEIQHSLQDELARKERDALQENWKNHQDQDAFIDQLRNITDINFWKIKRPDLLYWHKVFNIIDEILENIIESGQVYQSNQKILTILHFLKFFMHHASNASFFNSTERLVQIFQANQDNLQIIEEIIKILIILSSKKNDKKMHPSPQHQKQGLERFDQDITSIMNDSIMGYIQNFDFFSDILINLKEDTKFENVQAIINQEAQREEDYKERGTQFQVLRRLNSIIKSKENLEDAFVIILKAINLYLNIGDINASKDKHQQQEKLEQLLPPKSLIDKFIKILQNTVVDKKVHIQLMSDYFLLIILDLNQLFNYSQPTENQYYLEATNHHEFYINIMNQLSVYHAYYKILKLQEQRSSLENLSDGFTQAIESFKSIIGDDDSFFVEEKNISNTIKSQRFLKNFLDFMCNLLSIKNRTLQNQLYPQSLKPLLTIVTLNPIGNLYPININCQLKAAKLLKDVVKQSTLDDPNAIERVIQRVKYEVKLLNEPDIIWETTEDDDTENQILLVYRQDLIRTLLRFLSYSIIRNDPNAINFTQNFIANSRKILDSDLVQEDLLKNIFEANMSDNTERVQTYIDPVLLQCLQLVSYIFNDLPQKIPQFIENGFFEKILKSLSHRIPIQPDLITILMKFIQTLCLNPQSQELVVKSNVIQTFSVMTLNPKAMRQFVNQMKAMTYKDLIQQIVLNNKDIAIQMCKCFMQNFVQLIDKAWDVTEHYVIMEEEIRNNPNMDEKDKDWKRIIYEKEQVALEKCCESAANLLWYFAIDEQLYRQDNYINNAIQEMKDEILDIFHIFISTPIIASACNNLFPPFIEIMLQFLHSYHEDTKTEFMASILEFTNIQMENIYKEVGTTDLDQITDLEIGTKPKQNIILDEFAYQRIDKMSNQDTYKRKQDLVNRLSGEDQLAVVFGKISFYCEIVKGCQPVIKQRLIQNHNLSELMYKLFKVQSMVNRFHAQKYARDLVIQKQKFNELKPKYQELLQNTDFTNFKYIETPTNEVDEVKNLYYKYEWGMINSLTDPRSRRNEKTIIELQLDENMSHTSNLCQLSIRKLTMNLLRMLNKKKMHFSDKIDIKTMEFNRQIGKLIAQQFNDFQRLPSDSSSHLEIMKLCCQFSAIFSEFNKVLLQNYSFGSMFISFINNKGLDYVKSLVMWLLKFQFKLQKKGEEFPLDLCKNIQLLWSHIIDFFVQLIEGRYLDQQFNQYLISFKNQPLEKIKPEDQQKEHEQAVGKMQKYFMNLFCETLRFLYVELNESSLIKEFLPNKQLSSFEYFDMTSELFFQSYFEIYVLMTRSLSHCKIFNQMQLSNFKVADNQKHSQYETNKKLLVEMGFAEDQALYALQESRNDMDIALDMLSNQVPFMSPDKIKIDKAEKVEESKEEVEHYVELIDYGQLGQKDLYKLINITISDFIKFIPVNFKVLKKHEAIDNLYFTIGKDYQKHEVYQLLQDVKRTLFETITESHINKDFNNMGTLSYSLACLLSFKRGELLGVKEVFQAVFEIISLFQMTTAELKKLVDADNKDQLNKEQIIYYIKQLDQSLSLFLFISEESKISSDLLKIGNIIQSRQQLIDNISDIQIELEKIQKQNDNNLFYKNKEQTAEIFHKVTLLMIDLFKSMNHAHPQIETIDNFSLFQLIKKALENLNFMLNIKGYADFDCQSCFLQNEGLRALFSIRFVNETDQNTAFNAYIDQKKYNDIQVQSKILLQQLCQNEPGQIKIYENLIKSILFIQFQEVYKKEEGQDIKSLFNIEEFKQQQQIKPLTTSKKKRSSTPIKRSKSEEKMLLQSDEKAYNTQQKNQSKMIKHQIYKKQDYGEVLIEDFINFFSNVMQIQDLKSFLLACANVCVIKRKKPKIEKVLDFEEKKQQQQQQQPAQESDKQTSEQKQESPKKEEEEKKKHDRERKQEQTTTTQSMDNLNEQKVEQRDVFVISLSHNTLKDMVLQYGQSLQHQQTVCSIQNMGSDQEKIQLQKGSIQKFQSEIIFTFLDLFIDQIRDQQMVILQSSKQKQVPSSFGVTFIQKDNAQFVNDENQKISDQKYFFDIVCILSHLTYILTHTPILVQSLLKHKEGKTFKFIIRNIYFLMTLQMEKTKGEDFKEFKISISEQTLTKKRIDQIIEFFKRVMLDNPHLTIQEKKLKQDARNIFIKEVNKNLCEHHTSQKYPQWPLLGLVFNIGAIWLIAYVLKEEDKEEPSSEKNLEQLVSNMQKFRNIIRSNMIKQLIYECQQMTKSDQFNLLKQLERVQSEIQANLQHFNFSKEQIYLCVSAISNILKPFENNKAIWGDREADKGSLLNESNLGFLTHDAQSLAIDEEMNEDEDEEEEEDEDEEESESENEDDDLLDSERSERNFGFGENGEFDEEYGDEDEDEDDEDEDMDEDDISGADIEVYDEQSADDQDSSGQAGHPIEVDAQNIQLIGDLLGLDYSNGDEEPDDDYYEGNQSRRRQASQQRSASSQPNQPQQQENHNNEQANEEQQEGQEQQEQDVNQEEYDDDEMGEYDSEDEGDDASDDYYDEELDDDEDQQEIEIYVGRDPNNLERLSNIEYAGQRIGQQRREDVLSLNNMSVDMFNINHIRNGTGLPYIREEQESMEHSDHHEEYSHEASHGQQHQQRQLHGRQTFSTHENLGGVLSDLIGMFLGRRTRGQGQSYQASIRNLIEEKLNQNNVAYSPLETLTTIYEINRQIQETPDIYKLFIREQTENQASSNIRSNQEQPSNQVQQPSDLEISTKSQFSPKKTLEAQQQRLSGQRPGEQMPSTTNQNQIMQINTSTQPKEQQNLSILDNIDPEFLQNLDPDALQNLAETENVINRIHSQSSQVQPERVIQSTTQLLEAITNPEQRAEIYRSLTDDIFNQLPSHLFSEGLLHRPNQRAQQLRQQEVVDNQVNNQGQDQPPINIRPNDRLPENALVLRASPLNIRARPQEGRGRLMSLDSQLNDLADFSRTSNDPYFRAQSMNVMKAQNINLNELSVNMNSLFNNFVQYLKDLIAEMGNQVCLDGKGNDINKLSEQLVAQSLALTTDNVEQSYNKVSGMINMIMIWVKYLTNGGFIMFKEQNLMRILFRIVYVRQGLTLNIYDWMADGINQFKNYYEDQRQLVYKARLKQDTKGFKIERGGGLPGKLDIMDFVLHCLRCFKQIVQECNKISTNASLDLLKIPSQDVVQKFIIGQLNQQNICTIEVDKPLIEQIINQLVVFTKIIDERPDLINQQAYVIEGKEVWMEDIISTLSMIFQWLALASENYQALKKQQDQQPLPIQFTIQLSDAMITQIGELLLTKEYKQKEIQKSIKSIFNDLSKIGEGSNVVEQFFTSSLSRSLTRFIEYIKQPKIDSESLKKEVIILSQILKIARSNKKQESNICDEDLFFKVVNEISELINKKQLESNLHSISHASFIFKEEFRTIMITLFILFEYNLRFIFTDQQEEIATSSRRRQNLGPNQRRQQGVQQQRQIQQQQQQQQEIIMQDVEEIKQLDLQKTASISKEKCNLMDAIDEHLKIKIKDEKARDDKRLKIFIKFCLENKKIINSFIRANQQVLNESLRNVIMKVPQILDFDNKRLLFRGQIKKIQRKYRLKYIDIQVRRDKVFDDSYAQLRSVGVDRWRGQLNVEFADEQGVDEGGLSREWFILLSQQIFNPDLALFLQSNAGSTYYPNPKSDIDPDYLNLFKFIGRIVGKAIYEQQLLDCYFVKALYKIMLGLPLNYHDVEDFDNELYKNLKWCLENSVEGLGLTFTETVDYYGQNKEIEIIEGGKDLEVTDENKAEYVQRMAYQKLYGSIKKQVDSFLSGFYDIIPKHLIQIFDNRELELLISGLPSIDIMDLKENTIYQNYTAETPVVKWLFEVLEEFDNSERAEFIQFVTGSSKVPVEGFKGLRGSRGIQKFQIVKFFTNDTNRLPQAHTCFKQLELPEYSSKEQLKDRLYTAIKEGKTFGFA